MGRQDKGSYAIAFLINTRDSYLSKSGPCRRFFLIGESRIAHCSFGLKSCWSIAWNELCQPLLSA
jgi:hypothetical protein